MSLPRRAFALLAGLALALAPCASARAQEPAGSVAGTAVSAEEGAPVPLSLVQLLPGAGSDEPLRGALTDAQGEFRFDAVPVGRYRLRMDRIGLVAAPSEPFEVRAGETVRRIVSAGVEPVEIEGISVSGNDCYGLDRLDEASDLSALWREARKALEIRRGFVQQYRFTYDRRVEGRVRLRLLRDQRLVQDTTIVSHPDSVRARQARHREGFGRQSRVGFTIRIPDEFELLDEEFLRTHCLEGDAEDGAGALALRFRPTRAPRGGVLDLRGVIRIDPATFAVRELEFEYLNGRTPVARGTLHYTEVTTPDGPIRLPAGGTLSADPRGTVGMMMQGFTGTFRMTGYRDFERLRDAAALR